MEGWTCGIDAADFLQEEMNCAGLYTVRTVCIVRLNSSEYGMSGTFGICAGTDAAQGWMGIGNRERQRCGKSGLSLVMTREKRSIDDGRHSFLCG